MEAFLKMTSNQKYSMIVEGGSNTLYDGVSIPKSKVKYIQGGHPNIPFAFSNKLVLFLVGIAHRKLNYTLLSTYNKLNSIFVRTCRLMHQ